MDDKNVQVLKCFEQHIEGVQILDYFMQMGEELTHQELVSDIRVDGLCGYEYLLPVMLLTPGDPVIERTMKRLFLRWFRQEVEDKGAEKTVDAIARLLDEEAAAFKARRDRLIQLDRQNRL